MVRFWRCQAGRGVPKPIDARIIFADSFNRVLY
jgi:hypothetical protein